MFLVPPSVSKLAVNNLHGLCVVQRKELENTKFHLRLSCFHYWHQVGNVTIILFFRSPAAAVLVPVSHGCSLSCYCWLGHCCIFFSPPSSPDVLIFFVKNHDSQHSFSALSIEEGILNQKPYNRVLLRKTVSWRKILKAVSIFETCDRFFGTQHAHELAFMGMDAEAYQFMMVESSMWL